MIVCFFFLPVVYIFYVVGLFVNRREVYRILKAEGIQLPRYAVLNRDPARPEGLYNGSKIFVTLTQQCFYVLVFLDLQM